MLDRRWDESGKVPLHRKGQGSLGKLEFDTVDVTSEGGLRVFAGRW